jgi:hypothetical protein
MFTARACYVAMKYVSPCIYGYGHVHAKWTNQIPANKKDLKKHTSKVETKILGFLIIHFNFG